jgi:CheY-like chemotaxis protein
MANGLNVMVADDEKPMAEIISAVVEQMGHSADIVHDGENALVRIKETPDHYQILITDHAMIRMNGLKLVENLKQTAFRGKILVVTGYWTLQLEDSYHSLGVTTILRKPFKIDDLRAAVRVMASGYAK